MSNNRPDYDPYEEAVRGEVLRDIGHSIHGFRHILESVNLEAAQSMTIKDLLRTVDQVYQNSLDQIFDSLTCAADMRMTRTALSGIRRSMDIKRGFVREVPAKKG